VKRELIRERKRPPLGPEPPFNTFNQNMREGRLSSQHDSLSLRRLGGSLCSRIPSSPIRRLGGSLPSMIPSLFGRLGGLFVGGYASLYHPVHPGGYIPPGIHASLASFVGVPAS